MSTPSKPTPSQELERIEEALIESLLEEDGGAVREEITSAGGDPEALIAQIDAAIASARAKAARRRLERARSELSAWHAKSGPASDFERQAARMRFERLRSGGSDPEAKMMMAARKGEGLSETDIEGLIDDMAELERLEREDGD